jgi:hypothetical protein
MLRVTWHTGGDDIVTGDLLRAFGSMSFFLCLKSCVFLQMVTFIFPLLIGLKWKPAEMEFMS